MLVNTALSGLCQTNIFILQPPDRKKAAAAFFESGIFAQIQG